MTETPKSHSWVTIDQVGIFQCVEYPRGLWGRMGGVDQAFISIQTRKPGDYGYAPMLVRETAILAIMPFGDGPMEQPRSEVNV